MKQAKAVLWWDNSGNLFVLSRKVRSDTFAEGVCVTFSAPHDAGLLKRMDDKFRKGRLRYLRELKSHNRMKYKATEGAAG